MRESFVKALKWLILAFSLIMFFYQAQIAVNKYQNPPVVDSTDLINIEDIEPPVITICPIDQFKSRKFKEMGYFSYNSFLLGLDSKNNVTAWGAQYNMTFEEMIEEIEDLDKDFPSLEYKMDNKGPWLKAEYDQRYYPTFGRCIDFYNYTATGDLELLIKIDKVIDFYAYGSTSYQLSMAEVFLTDKKLRTRITVHKQSHWGSSIIIENGKVMEFLIKVEQLSNFDPRKPDDCIEYTDDEFENCVDEELQDLWKPIIGCNPPWLSPQKQCNATLNTTDAQDDLLYSRTSTTIDDMIWMKNYAAKDRCTKACHVTRPNILKNTERTVYGPAKLKIVFDDIVVRKTKMLAYDFSDLFLLCNDL